MKKIIDFLASIRADRLLHFIAGMIITAVVAIVLPKAAPLAFIMAFVAGFAKEVFDEINYGGFDYVDMLYTFVGGVVMQIIIFGL